jgi:superfamily II DNA or RNA helicase
LGWESYCPLSWDKFKGFVKNLIVLSGDLSKKERELTFERLENIPDDSERLIIATGKFIGEGFDDSRLDTLFLAMPFSWKGTLQQYTGRLHRNHANKEEVKVYDYVDIKVPVFKRMYAKRLKGYRAMVYALTRKENGKPEQMQLF